MACDARATDWSLRGTLTELGSVNDNPDFTTDPAGVAFGTRTSIGADLLGLTPHSRFDLRGDLAYQHYFGSGADAIAGGLFPDLTASYEDNTRSTTFRAEAN